MELAELKEAAEDGVELRTGVRWATEETRCVRGLDEAHFEVQVVEMVMGCSSEGFLIVWITELPIL